MLDTRNISVLSGRLTRDPELVGGDKVARFGLAVDFSGRDATDDANKTGFFDLVLFQNDANRWVFDQITKGEMKKGSAINVLGRLSHNRYEVDGRKASKVEIIIESLNYASSGRPAAEKTDTDEGTPLPSRF